MSTVFTTLKEEYNTNEEELMGLDAALTAFAGGGAGHLVLDKKWNLFTTVATDGDSADLPLALIGERCYIYNLGAHSMEVFPNVVDTIDSGTVTSIVIPPSKFVELESIKDQEWKQKSLASVQTNVIEVALTITRAFILSFATTQRVLSVAPGVGFGHEVLGGALKYTVGGSTYTTGNGFGIYADTSTNPQATPAVDFTSATSFFQKLLLGNGDIIENKALVIKSLTNYVDTFTSGGNAKIYVAFRIVVL